MPYSNDAGACALDSSEIVVYISKTDSKLETILTIIHELGHALENIHNFGREPDPALEEAIGEEEKHQIGRASCRERV
mgnify:CR=1 FL=1